MSNIEGYSTQNGEPTLDNPAEIECLELEEKYIVHLTDEQYRDLVDVIRKETKQEFEQKVKKLKESVILDNTIVGGRRNAKTLEYGIKLGKIKAYEELLEDK